LRFSKFNFFRHRIIANGNGANRTLLYLGNLILVLVFNWLKNKTIGFRQLALSVLKFGWLFGTSQLVIKYFIKKQLRQRLPQ